MLYRRSFHVPGTLFLIIAALLAGCTGNLSDAEDPTGKIGAADHIINYTSEGFQPRRVTVAPGDTVAFVSEGPKMWVASNSHPTHADYGLDGGADPLFDQKRAGRVYSFTFNRAGEWQYHNHENAYHHGTVIVENAP